MAATSCHWPAVECTACKGNQWQPVPAACHCPCTQYIQRCCCAPCAPHRAHSQPAQSLFYVSQLQPLNIPIHLVVGAPHRAARRSTQAHHVVPQSGSNCGACISSGHYERCILLFRRDLLVVGGYPLARVMAFGHLVHYSIVICEYRILKIRGTLNVRMVRFMTVWYNC